MKFIRTLKPPLRVEDINIDSRRGIQCLAQIIPLGERHLRNTVAEYIEHCHAERNHQGLGNQLILKPRDGTSAKGNVACRE